MTETSIVCECRKCGHSSHLTCGDERIGWRLATLPGLSAQAQLMRCTECGASVANVVRGGGETVRTLCRGKEVTHDPAMPPRPCAHPSCPRLVTHGSYCPIHQKQRERAKNQRRGSAINTHLRNTIRARDGYRCRLCGSTVGIEVHHIRHWRTAGTRPTRRT